MGGQERYRSTIYVMGGPSSHDVKKQISFPRLWLSRLGRLWCYFVELDEEYDQAYFCARKSIRNIVTILAF